MKINRSMTYALLRAERSAALAASNKCGKDAHPETKALPVRPDRNPRKLNT
jgi:hypothetical protein